MLRLTRFIVLFLAVPFVQRSPGLVAAEPAPAPVPKSPYIAVVYRFADTLLEKGRDNNGPQSTGLFWSALDRVALAPLTNRPPAPTGVREGDRVGAPNAPLVGSNLEHDENLLRLLYLLTDLTTKPKYRDAADASLRWFLRNPPTAGFTRPWVLWERCFALAPEASRACALKLSNTSTPIERTSTRQDGFLLRTWAVAQAQTRDNQFLSLGAERLLREEKIWPPDGISLGDALSFAIDCEGAAHKFPEPIASRLHAMASRVDESVCATPHELLTRDGFTTKLSASSKASAAPRTARWMTAGQTPTTAKLGMLCVSRYDNSGRVGYRQLLLSAADSYLDSLPSDGDDVWPATLGLAISLQVAAWRHSANPAYLARARTLADFAIARFFESNALPRASLKTGHYESITGAGTLALALAELHLHVLHITAVRCPPNTIDR